MAVPYFREQKCPVFKAWAVPAAASMFSTAESLARWVSFQMNQGEVNGKSVLPQSFFESYFWQPCNDAVGASESSSCFSQTTYGMGWFSDRFAGERLMHHGGSAVGLTAFVGFFPDRKFGVVVLVNQVLSKLPRKLAKKIFEAELGMADLPEGLPAIKPNFSTDTIDLIMPGTENRPYRVNEMDPDNGGPLWFSEGLGEYEHVAYGMVMIRLTENGKLEAEYGRQIWPLFPQTRGYAIGELKFLEIPAQIRISRGETAGQAWIEIPFNIAPGCRPVRFVRAPAGGVSAAG